METYSIEKERLSIQTSLDEHKTQAERNKLGQFATPGALARDIVQFGLSLLRADDRIRFFDPAFGTGSFYSALIDSALASRIEMAKGFELDSHYGRPARRLWQDNELDLQLADFTTADCPSLDSDRFNFIICNPPYVRHHHIANPEKVRLQTITEEACGVRMSGLSGLYCYFLGLSHVWMQNNGLAGWLIPSEFMDVNYGDAVKRYLLDKVTLLRIHRFDPDDVQFGDAMVSSAVVWFRNAQPPTDHSVEFTLGDSLLGPRHKRVVPVQALRKERKWTRFPALDTRIRSRHYRVSDFFAIKRGIATGANNFFILRKEEIETRGLPMELFRPILPSPRYLPHDEVSSDEQGFPLLERRLFLLDCRLSEIEVEKRFPKLWEYLEEGKAEIAGRYLCRFRKVWYFQDERPPAPILCTYMGRNTKNGRPFRFIFNDSKATAANVYLLMYPKRVLKNAIVKDECLLRRIWEALNNLSLEHLFGEGRVYGGGLHKLEPRELSNVNATTIADVVSGIDSIPRPSEQLELFDLP